MDDGMGVYTSHASPSALCHAMNAVATAHAAESQSGLSFSPRPWNRFEPDDSEWWLVPSTGWPAYNHAKLYFAWRGSHRDALWTGVYLEKGLGPAVSDFIADKSQIMRAGQEWAWHRLLRSLRNGQLEARVDELARDLPVPVHIGVDALYARDKDFDPAVSGYGRDIYRFTWNPEDRRLDVAAPPERNGHVPESLIDVGSFQDLSGKLSVIDTQPWVWIDFTVLMPLSIAGQVPGEPAPWREAQLWDRFLYPLFQTVA